MHFAGDFSTFFVEFSPRILATYSPCRSGRPPPVPPWVAAGPTLRRGPRSSRRPSRLVTPQVKPRSLPRCLSPMVSPALVLAPLRTSSRSTRQRQRAHCPGATPGMSPARAPCSLPGLSRHWSRPTCAPRTAPASVDDDGDQRETNSPPRCHGRTVPPWSDRTGAGSQVPSGGRARIICVSDARPHSDANCNRANGFAARSAPAAKKALRHKGNASGK